MDEILFEGTHIRDKAFYKELGTYLVFQRPIMLVLHFIVLLTITFGFCNGVTNKVVLVITFLFYALCIFMLYNNYVSLSYKREMEQSNGIPVEITVFITESQITHINALGASVKIEISTIKRVNRSKNYVILISKTRQMYIIDKRKFTKGTPDELVAFLKSKGVK